MKDLVKLVSHCLCHCLCHCLMTKPLSQLADLVQHPASTST